MINHKAVIEATDKEIPLPMQLALIKRRTERGMRPNEIARLMDLDKKFVAKTIRSNGWKPKRDIVNKANETRSQARPNARYRSKELHQSIEALTASGHSVSKTAKELGVSYSLVRECINYFARGDKP